MASPGRGLKQVRLWAAAIIFLHASIVVAQTAIWKPAQNTSWQWQLTTPMDQTVDVAMYDIDLFENDATVVAGLHAKGRRVICYMSAGSWESFRADAGKFPDSVKGNALSGFPNEKWLDIRSLDILGPIMESRLDLCKAKGFDGVEPDNVDGYNNKTGFPLTYADQIRYNTFLAKAARARGLSVGLKNDLEQIRELEPVFDWALNEQCFEFKECSTLLPFVNAGKAVFQVEYKLATSQFCPQANAMNFNSMRKNLSLDVYREPCRESKTTLILPNGIVNGASFIAGPVAPGEVIAIFGSEMGPASLSQLKLNSSGLVDTSLAETRVLFDGVPAPLIYVQSSQLSAAVPYAVAGKSSTQVQVEYKTIRSDTVVMPVGQVAPGIFTVDASGKGQGAILNEDSTANSAANPAAKASIIALYATGEGQTEPPGIDGKVAGDVLPKPRIPVSVRIGGIEAEVLYAGAAPGLPAGILQVNARIPGDVSSGASVPVLLAIGNVTSQPGVSLAVR